MRKSRHVGPYTNQKVYKVYPITRGQDLTDEDLQLIADDLYHVRRWCNHSQLGITKEAAIGHMKRAIEVRLGRREQEGEILE